MNIQFGTLTFANCSVGGVGEGVSHTPFVLIIHSQSFLLIWL